MFVECAWLQHLSEIDAIPELPPFGPAANDVLDALKTQFTLADAEKVFLSVQVMHSVVFDSGQSV